MKIVLTTKKIDAPAFIFFRKQLKEISVIHLGKKISIDISHNPKKVKYVNYDVVLFMSYDEATYEAKKQNSRILTGIIDPRANHKNNLDYTDFLVVNGIESRDYFTRFIDNIFVYHLQFLVGNQKKLSPKNNKKFILGYHGNKIHLNSMFPRVTNALNKIAKEFDIELWAMYNVNKLGRCNFDKHKDILFKIKHIQYSEENYDKFLAKSDIGLVPQNIPIKKNIFFNFLVGTFDKRYNESNNDFFFRFKETTNLGRHLVFAQYGIPIISDMSPSACSFIEYGANGYLAHHSDSWYKCMRLLIENKKLRLKMGNNLKLKYKSLASPKIQNKNFISFLRKL